MAKHRRARGRGRARKRSVFKSALIAVGAGVAGFGIFEGGMALFGGKSASAATPPPAQVPPTGEPPPAQKPPSGGVAAGGGSTAGVKVGDSVVATTQTSANVNLRSGPGTGNPVIGRVPRGSTVVVEDIRNGWYKVTYQGKTGWASATYLLPAGKSAATGG